ncbi:unnamed protein product [Colias eurytheme]|nr:unnamed protein product [Colias eurytheme]
MSQPRMENMCPPTHLRVMLPTSLESNMPPTYIDINNLDIPPPQPDFSAPPPYDVAANSKLPTYEEVQREKQMEGEGPQLPTSHPTIAAFVTVEPREGGAEQLDPENNLLGTDIMFLTSFFVAFLFNWIGFLLLMCFCHTVASRYGALAGFGLSLAKWTLIVKHSTELASHENSWLWWLIMAFGILICVRAIIQYLNIKRGWRLLSGTAQERLLFFY